MVLPPRSPLVEVHLHSSVGCEKVSRTTHQSSAAFSPLFLKSRFCFCLEDQDEESKRENQATSLESRALWIASGVFTVVTSLPFAGPVHFFFFFNLVNKGRCLIGDRWKETFLCKLKWHLKDKDAIKLSPSGHHGYIC